MRRRQRRCRPARCWSRAATTGSSRYPRRSASTPLLEPSLRPGRCRSAGTSPRPRCSQNQNPALVRVLVAGGFNDAVGSLSDAHLYDPATGTFRPTLGTMWEARELYTATRIPDGRVLLAGGFRTGFGGG